LPELAWVRWRAQAGTTAGEQGLHDEASAWLASARAWVSHRFQIADVLLLLVASAEELQRGGPATATLENLDSFDGVGTDQNSNVVVSRGRALRMAWSSGE
jgi:hypothetical protein